MATFADMSQAQTESIQKWGTDLLDSRMEMIGRAASFVDNIDKKANALAAQTEQVIGRMAERVNEINRLQAVVQGIADVTGAKFDQVFRDFKTFTDEARTEISIGAVTNREAMAKAEEFRTSVNELFEKCRVVTTCTKRA